MTKPTGQTGVDDRVNDDDGLQDYVNRITKAVLYQGSNDHEDVRSILKQLIRAHTSAVLDRVEKGMPEVIGPNIPNIKGAVMYTYVNNILAEQRTKFTDLMKKVREEL